jgi:hypothetical protein
VATTDSDGSQLDLLVAPMTTAGTGSGVDNPLVLLIHTHMRSLSTMAALLQLMPPAC